MSAVAFTRLPIEGSLDRIGPGAYRLRFDRRDQPYASHYPHHAVIPAISIVRAVAHAVRAESGNSDWIVSAIERARFSAPTEPGDHVVAHLSTVATRPDSITVKVVVSGEAGKRVTLTLTLSPGPAAVVHSDDDLEPIVDPSILDRLPHRPPMLLAHRCSARVDDAFVASTLGLFTFSSDIEVARLSMFEGWAQTACLAVAGSNDDSGNVTPVIGAVRDVRWSEAVPHLPWRHEVLTTMSSGAAATVRGGSDSHAESILTVDSMSVAVHREVVASNA